MHLVQHILWGLSRMRCFFHGLHVVGVNHCSYFWLHRWELPVTTKGPRTGTTCSPSHLKGTTKEGTVTKCHLLVLFHPQEHLPWCCHYQMFQALATRLISVTSQDPATRPTVYSNSYVVLSQTGCFKHDL